MAVLNIRNLPDEVHARLRLRAARAGRSMEAEARAILTDACSEDELPRLEAAALQDFVSELYDGEPPRHVVDDFIADRRAEAERE